MKIEKEMPDTVLQPLIEWTHEVHAGEQLLNGLCSQLLEDESLAQEEETRAVITEIGHTSERHVVELQRLMAEFEWKPSEVRTFVNSKLGQTLGFVDRILPNRDPVREIRDVSVALNHVVASYQALFARASVYHASESSDLALAYLADYVPRVREVNQLIAWAAAQNLDPTGKPSEDALQRISAALRDVWRESES